MIQVTKVWWDGEKLMAEPIDPATIYQEPAQGKDWGAVGEAHIAAIKKSSKAMVEDAAVRAVHKVMAEFEAKSDEPVAVVSGYYGGQCVILPIDPARIFNSNTPLYTATQPCPTCEALARTVMLDQTSHDAQRKPLTDEQIDKLPWGPHEGNPMTFAEGLRDFARAIEAAHGIKENT